jgi:hypothetical protein
MLSRLSRFAAMACSFLLLVAPVFSQKMKEVKCADGNPVMIPKKPADAYSPVIKQTSFTLKGTISVLDKVKLADIDAGTKKSITELRDKLSQYSSQCENIIKASYLAFCSVPCDTNVRKRHFDLLDELVKQNAAMEELRIKMTDLAKSGNAAGIDNASVKALLLNYDKKKAENVFQKK